MLINKEKCSTCGMCAHVCPKKAISFVHYREGFKYPEINQNLCIDCGLCSHICGFNSIKFEKENQDFYAGFSKSQLVRLESRSGGAFYEMAKTFIENNPDSMVIGAALLENLTVKHVVVTDISGLKKLQKSKYVQSDTVEIFPIIEENLRKGKAVLFSGTPCQISSLKNFLMYKKLEAGKCILVDFVCHGCPSPKIFEENIKAINKKFNVTINSVNFRNKNFGWKSHIESYQTETKTIFTQNYTSLFFEHLILRESCFYCPFTTYNRCSDITIADGWGLEKYVGQDNKGISLIILNTEKGKNLFTTFQENMYLYPVEKKNIKNPRFLEPALKPINYEQFWQDYMKNDDFIVLCKKYISIKQTLINKLKLIYNYMRYFNRNKSE